MPGGLRGDIRGSRLQDRYLQNYYYALRYGGGTKRTNVTPSPAAHHLIPTQVEQYVVHQMPHQSCKKESPVPSRRVADGVGKTGMPNRQLADSVQYAKCCPARCHIRTCTARDIKVG